MIRTRDEIRAERPPLSIETAPEVAPGSTESAEKGSGVDGPRGGDSRAVGTLSGGSGIDVMADADGERSWITLACGCQWSADIEDPVSLRDLNERALEHAEVCR